MGFALDCRRFVSNPLAPCHCCSPLFAIPYSPYMISVPRTRWTPRGVSVRMGGLD